MLVRRRAHHTSAVTGTMMASSRTSATLLWLKNLLLWMSRQIGQKSAQPVCQCSRENGHRIITPIGADVSGDNASMIGWLNHAHNTARKTRARVSAIGHRHAAATVAAMTAAPMLCVSRL